MDQRREVIGEDERVQDSIDFMKNIWSHVKKSTQMAALKPSDTQATIKLASPAKPDDRLLADLVSQPRLKRPASAHRLDRVDESSTDKPFTHMDLSKSFCSQHDTELPPKTNKLPPQYPTKPPQPMKHPPASLEEKLEVLTAKVKHYRQEVVKKDAEILYLRSKLREHRKVTKHLEVMDTEPIDLIVEVARLKANNDRLCSLLSESVSTSKLFELYSPQDCAYLELDMQHTRSSSKQSYRFQRDCCSSNTHKFGIQEITQWVPKDVNKLANHLSASLGLPTAKDKSVREFVCHINQIFLSREKEVLDRCVKKFEKEIKDMKVSLIDQPILIQNKPGLQKRKSDKQAFMEGASWMLTKIQADVNTNSNLLNSALDNPDSTPDLILKALAFSTDGIKKLQDKLRRYETHIRTSLLEEKSRQAEEDKENLQKQQPKKRSKSRSKKPNRKNFGYEEAETEALEFRTLEDSTLWSMK